MSNAAASPLSSSVLVLNRLYMAVHVVSVRRAFGLLFRELAEVIHVEQGQYANYDFDSCAKSASCGRPSRTARRLDPLREFRDPGPAVIRLLTYDRLPKQAIRFNRRNILRGTETAANIAAGNFPLSELSLDHVNPRSRGGETTWENIVCSCVKCNVRKGGRTPQEAHMHLVKLPVKPKRSPLLSIKLGNPKYESWKSFLDNAYWSVDLK